MKDYNSILVKGISYFFILLFIYASVSKLLEFEKFQVQLAQSPLLSAYAGSISYTIIIVELITAGLLSISKSRMFGLLVSFNLMIAFSIYIYLILYHSEFVPCSCGGILEDMGWKTHLIFNIITVVIAGLAILIVNRSSTSYTVFPRVSVRLWFMLGTGILSSCLVVYLFFSSEYIIKKKIIL